MKTTISDMKGYFSTHVDKTGPMNPMIGICWVWTGPTYNGTAVLELDGHRVSAMRFVLFLDLVEITSDMDIFMECGNPLCVKRDHVFVGVKQIDDNRCGRNLGLDGAEECEASVYVRRRKVRDEDEDGDIIVRPAHKLTEDDVVDIRRMYNVERMTQSDIAYELGMSPATVWTVIQGTDKFSTKSANFTHLTPELAQEIRREYREGEETQGHIAKKHNIAQTTVSMIVRNKVYPEIW